MTQGPSETYTLQRIRLELSNGPTRLLRNNCGAFQDATGRWVQFGIGHPGGSDLIGWTTIGGVAVFCAVEVKRAGHRATPDQQRFIDLVRAAGGIAGVACSVEDARLLVRGTAP